MIHVDYYVSDDGQKFDSEYECECHEWVVRRNSTPGMVAWADYNLEPLEVSPIINVAEIEVVRTTTPEMSRFIHDLFRFGGYMSPFEEYLDKDNLPTGIFFCDDDGNWKKVNEKLGRLEEMLNLFNF
jgi:hypothetical protein